MTRKIISMVLSLGLLFQQGGLVYAVGELNLANYLSQARNAIVQPDRFQPARLRYISYDMANNDFKLLLDKGNAKLNDATPELFNYFLIGLALPNDTFWVNLRPDAAENIIDPLLEKTDIGKIFLEADLQLKKDTASLTSPQTLEGKQYWDKLYKKAGELFGTENITIPTITRPWIVPNEVIVRETDDSAYIYKATLKVMLEQDHLKDSVAYNLSDPRLKELNEYSSQIIRETIIPKLTKEVNSSKRYAKLRQVYYSLVLSRWFKQKYSSLGGTGAPEHQGTRASVNNYVSLIDSGKLTNLASKEPCDKQNYFQAYQKSFKDGEYNLKETVPTPFGQSIRSYISGGISVGSPIKSGNLNIGVANREVTNELAGQLSPAIVGSPIEMTRLTNAFKKIQSGLKDINAIVSFLSQPKNGYNSKIQGISNPLGQVMSTLQKKINYLGQIRTEKISIGDILSDFGKLKDDLGKIQSAINKFVEISSVENNSRNIKGSMVGEKFNNLSEGIVEVLKQVEELDKELQNSSGSPVLGKEFVVYDINTAKNVRLQYVTDKELLAVFNKETIKEMLQAAVFASKINMDGKESDNKKEPISYGFPVVNDAMLEGIHFAVKIEGVKLKSIKGIVYNDGKEIIFYGETAYIAKDILDVWKKEVGVSSAVVSKSAAGKWGGIDLTDRALHIKLERGGSFASTPLLLPQVKNTENLDLDKEFEQIEALASSGIVPNSHRLLELFTVCHYRGEFGQRLNQIISCLKASSAIQEAEAIDSDEDFRLALILPEMLS